MALTDYKINNYANPVSSLPDSPTNAGMTAAELKAAFDANATGEIKTSINGIIDYLEDLTGSENIKGIRIADDGQIEVTTDGSLWTKPSDAKVDKVIGKGLSTNDYDNTEKGKVTENTTARHTHTNKAILDGIDQADVDKWDNTLPKDNTEAYTPTGAYNPATKKYVDDTVVAIGSADMQKAVYDPNGHETDIFAYAVPRVATAVTGNIAVFGTGGVIADGNLKFSIYNGGLRVSYDDGQ